MIRRLKPYFLKTIVTGLLLSLGTHAENSDGLKKYNDSQAKLISELVSTYSKFSQIDMDVKKTSVQNLLGKKSESSGKMSIASKGMFYWKVEEPQKTLLIFDGNLVWNEEKIPEDFGGGVKVLKSKSFKNTPAYQIMQLLMGNGKFTEHFSSLRTQQTEKENILTFTPLSKSWNLSLVKLYINKAGDRLLGLSYMDDIENSTEFVFTKVDLVKELDRKKFSYEAPKGAQISEM